MVGGWAGRAVGAGADRSGLVLLREHRRPERRRAVAGGKRPAISHESCDYNPFYLFSMTHGRFRVFPGFDVDQPARAGLCRGGPDPHARRRVGGDRPGKTLPYSCSRDYPQGLQL